jgi:hypothetical protein
LEAGEIGSGVEGWPEDVRAVVESLETAFPPILQRRKLPRTAYKRQGVWEPKDGGEAFAVYSRDANMWTVGFLTSHKVESNQRGVLRLVGPDGVEREMRSRVIRAREVRPGWFDVAVEFPTEEIFAEERILRQ